MLTAAFPTLANDQTMDEQYQYFEGGDIEGFLATWDQQAILRFPASLSIGGTGLFEGKPAIAQFFHDLRSGLGPKAVRVINCGRRADKVIVEWTYGPTTADSLNWWVTQLHYNSAGLVIEARCYTDTLKLRELLNPTTVAV